MRCQIKGRMLVGLLAVIAATAQPATVQACPPPVRGESNLAPMTQQADIAPDGGVVVIAVNGGGKGPDSYTIAPLVLTTNGEVVTPKVRELADGLEVWQFAPKPKDASTVMTWGLGERVTLTVGAKGAALKAPQLKIIASSTRRPSRARMAQYRYGSPSTTLAIRLANPLPDDAVALVVTLGSGRTARGAYWSALESGKTDFTFDGGGKGCAGSSESVYIGEPVRITYVTASGRVSPVATARATRLTEKMAETFTQ